MGRVGRQQLQHLQRAGARVAAAGLQHHADPGPQGARVADRVEPEHAHLTRVRPPESLADLDRRGLAGAVRPEQRRHRAGRDLEREPVDSVQRAVGLDQSRDLHRRLHSCESRNAGAIGPQRDTLIPEASRRTRRRRACGEHLSVTPQAVAPSVHEGWLGCTCGAVAPAAPDAIAACRGYALSAFGPAQVSPYDPTPAEPVDAIAPHAATPFPRVN